MINATGKPSTSNIDVKPAVRIAQISLEDDSLTGPSTKRPRVDDSAETVWLKLDKHILTSDDKLSLTCGLQLKGVVRRHLFLFTKPFNFMM